jgi:hypothetical protein
LKLVGFIFRLGLILALGKWKFKIGIRMSLNVCKIEIEKKKRRRNSDWARQTSFGPTLLLSLASPPPTYLHSPTGGSVVSAGHLRTPRPHIADTRGPATVGLVHTCVGRFAVRWARAHRLISFVCAGSRGVVATAPREIVSLRVGFVLVM